MVTGRKLLLADDSVTIQKVVDLTFSDEGLEVITASDGQQALDKLDDIVPDIVLADVHMPQLNGYELCELIKQDDRFRHIPVMLLVGSFEPFDEAEARRVGADDYLTKPFQSIRTLISKVHHLLSGEKGGLNEATTRNLAPPPEAELVNRADPEFIERSTADTAPLPDVHEESENGVASSNIAFADLSMDDELIETSPVGDYHGSDRNADPRSTMQYSAADLREEGIAQAIETPPASQETLDAYAPAYEGEHLPAAFHSQHMMHASDLASSEDALLDLGDFEPSGAMAEADDFFLDLVDDRPVLSQASSSAPMGASRPAFEYDQSPSASADEIEAPASTDFGEAGTDSRGLSSAEVSGEPLPASTFTHESRFEQESFGETEVPATERLPDDYRVDVATAVFDTPSPDYSGLVEAPPPTGPITLAQISPEVIDAIARRAVEQLSERAVEQIAWEVVPALAERLIKRRLEEE